MPQEINDFNGFQLIMQLCQSQIVLLGGEPGGKRHAVDGIRNAELAVGAVNVEVARIRDSVTPRPVDGSKGANRCLANLWRTRIDRSGFYRLHSLAVPSHDTCLDDQIES